MTRPARCIPIYNFTTFPPCQKNPINNFTVKGPMAKLEVNTWPEEHAPGPRPLRRPPPSPGPQSVLGERDKPGSRPLHRTAPPGDAWAVRDQGRSQPRPPRAARLLPVDQPGCCSPVPGAKFIRGGSLPRPPITQGTARAGSRHSRTLLWDPCRCSHVARSGMRSCI